MADERDDGVTPPPEFPQPAADTPVVVSFPDGNRLGLRNAPPLATSKALVGPRPAWMALCGIKADQHPTPRELRAAREQRKRLCYQLTLKHVPTREVARQLGISNKTVWYDAEAYRLSMNRMMGVPLARQRDFQVAEHSENLRGLWAEAENTSNGAQARIMARTEIRQTLAEVAKLTGTYMPLKVASTTPDGTRWAPLAAEQLAAMFTSDQLDVLELAQRAKLRLGTGTIDAEVVDDEDEASRK